MEVTKDLVTTILLSCPHCGSHSFIESLEDADGNTIATVLEADVCGTKWKITTKVEKA